ncbi:MAG: type 1 glutamine amidotransferase [Sedimentisphaerales bacterium]|nr:type 1 glutamine amidotransferase [Sedimentisphaerales bacterium]
MMRICCVMHVPFENEAEIGQWAARRRHELFRIHLYGGDSLPPMEAFEATVIMGGPMNVYEENIYPWLTEEKKWIQETLENGKPVLGVCLGAQLIADVLGAKISRQDHKEIGWYDIVFTEQALSMSYWRDFAPYLKVFHWHGDTFAIPPGAVRLAGSEACENQAFQYENNVLALQFHIEYTPQSIEKMLQYCSEELEQGPWIQTAEAIRAGYRHIPGLRDRLHILLDRIFADTAPTDLSR